MVHYIFPSVESDLKLECQCPIIGLARFGLVE